MPQSQPINIKFKAEVYIHIT